MKINFNWIWNRIFIWESGFSGLHFDAIDSWFRKFSLESIFRAMNVNSVSPDEDEVIAKLLDMGFENSTVVDAVKEVGPSFDDALDYVLNGCSRNNQRALSSSKCTTRNVKALGKRAFTAPGQIRQSSILDHFHSTGRPKRIKTEVLPDVSVSGSKLCASVEQCEIPPSGVDHSVEVLTESSASDCLDIRSDWEKTANSLLQKRFGYSSLKSFQKEVLAAWMAHRDSLVLAATGSGIISCLFLCLFSLSFC